MVWFSIFLLIISIGGSLCDLDESCYQRMRKNCDYSELPGRFPETTDELSNACSAIKTLTRCILTVRENCPDEEDIRVEHFRKIVEYIDNACEEDSSVFQVISNNIKCVANHGATVDDECRFSSFSPEAEEYLTSQIKSLTAAGHYDSEEDFECVQDFLVVTCLSSTMGFHCGNATRDVTYEILENIHDTYGTCREEIRRALETLRNDFEIVIRNEQTQEKDFDDV